jgi:ubiquinone/menaquinone biosynthesis C-methylase UbiE
MSLSEAELKAFKDFEKTGWDRAADPYHQHWGGLSQQSAEAMLDAAEVGKGSRVLDIATGAGYVAAAAAMRGARTVGLDFSAAQVDLAKKTYPDVEFRQGDAEDLPFEDGSFDAVVIGFGVNHLPYPERGFAQAFRVLRPGGIFAYTVWAAPKPGEGFGIVLGAIESHGDKSVALPPAPPYFRFADSNEARRVFEETGFVEPQTRIVDQFWQHERPDRAFDAFNEGAVRATAMLRGQPAAAREKIRSAVCAQVERLYRGGRYIVPVPAALSWARKP